MPARKNDRITIEALKYYVPLFQKGEAAENFLLENFENLSAGEINNLETVMKLKDLSAKKIAELSAPLITREINKIIATSHLRTSDDLFNILYYAGFDGMKRGLRKFEVEKINSSSTNYLFQWITTYAKKELITLESPFGIPPSRYQRYKKISAVRKKISHQIERYASNEEVFEYFMSGKADLKNMNGKVALTNVRSKANLSITLDLIKEQEKFEKEMFSVSLLDPLDSYADESKMVEDEVKSFSETIFGVFSKMYSVTEEAKLVMMSELRNKTINSSELDALEDISQVEYAKIAKQWKNLIKDVNGKFYAFLLEVRDLEFTEFDISSAIKLIESAPVSTQSNNYNKIFKK